MEQRLILDRYRPLAELGEGGHGSVTLAYDTRMARRVAIKRLPLPTGLLGGRRQQRNAGLAEARTAAMLNHPHIVTVFEWDTDDDEAFLIMEHVEGLSLAEVLDAEHGALPLDEVGAVVKAVAGALSFAHRNGVFHLDVKPENVLVDRDGLVKVADFGISALTRADGAAESVSGTLGYMPLEQLTDGHVDARTDQWALAALVYEALAGANPFDADSVEGALFKQRYGDAPLPSEFAPDLPPAIDDVLMRALSPDPTDRFDSVSDLAAQLLPWLGDPDEGREGLADIVRDALEEEPAEERAAAERIGLWDRLAWRVGWFRRGGAALASGWLALLGLTALSLPRTAALAGVALIALAGVLAPPLGFALGLGSLAAGSYAQGLGAGLAVSVVAVAVWLGVGRRGGGDMVAAVLAPVLGVTRMALAAPLLLGFVFEPVPAAIASALAAVWTMAFAAMSGTPAPLLAPDLTMLARPWLEGGPGALRVLVSGAGPLITVLTWAAAGAVSSHWCRFGTRFSAALGMGVGMLVLLGGYLLWSLTGPPLPWPEPALLQQVTGSLILVTIVIAAGAPTRGDD